MLPASELHCFFLVKVLGQVPKVANDLKEVRVVVEEKVLSSLPEKRWMQLRG